MTKQGTAAFERYVAACPARVRPLLQELRAAIVSAAPNAVEGISYDMPAFTLENATRIGFGAFKSHVGFYPGAAAVKEFKRELASYKTTKGSVALPIDQPLPKALIMRIVRFCGSRSKTRT